jgi:hypothetical protein
MRRLAVFAFAIQAKAAYLLHRGVYVGSEVGMYPGSADARKNVDTSF